MDYNRLANSVAKKLATYGRRVTLRQYPLGSATFNPATLKVSPAATTPVETQRYALVTEQPGQRIGPQYGTNTKPSTLIQDAEKWIYMDAKGPRPKPNDKVVIDDEVYNITDAQETAPGGIPLFYLLVLDR